MVSRLGAGQPGSCQYDEQATDWATSRHGKQARCWTTGIAISMVSRLRLRQSVFDSRQK
jgi:hypothetical protein